MEERAGAGGGTGAWWWLCYFAEGYSLFCSANLPDPELIPFPLPICLEVVMISCCWEPWAAPLFLIDFPSLAYTEEMIEKYLKNYLQDVGQ